MQKSVAGNYLSLIIGHADSPASWVRETRERTERKGTRLKQEKTSSQGKREGFGLGFLKTYREDERQGVLQKEVLG